jgi:hypothetical protein
MVVVSGDERDLAAVGVPQALDGRGQNAGQFRADQQQTFLVALGRHDLQQRDDLAGVGELVGDQREVGDLGEFLDAYSGVPQGLDDGPDSERLVLGHALVDALRAALGLGCRRAG